MSADRFAAAGRDKQKCGELFGIYELTLHKNAAPEGAAF